jgi:hypothetical protein
MKPENVIVCKLKLSASSRSAHSADRLDRDRACRNRPARVDSGASTPRVALDLVLVLDSERGRPRLGSGDVLRSAAAAAAPCPDSAGTGTADTGTKAVLAAAKGVVTRAEPALDGASSSAGSRVWPWPTVGCIRACTSALCNKHKAR